MVTINHRHHHRLTGFTKHNRNTQQSQNVTRIVGVKTEKSSVQQNDRMVGAAMTKPGRAFHAWVATTGNQWSPDVIRHVTGTNARCYLPSKFLFYSTVLLFYVNNPTRQP